MSTGTVSPLPQWKRWIPTPPVMAAWAVLVVGFFVTYRETLLHMVRVWYNTPDYGHGFFVPIFAGFLLWQRQEMVNPWPNKGTWWGIPFFAVFALVRWLCLFLNYERDIDSLLPFLFGMTLILGGWRALRWAWPSIIFLIFMVPLPDFLASALGGKLQRGATIMSVYVLQSVGVPAITLGDASNVIQLSEPSSKLEVARACSGLRMMTLFFAVCVGASFVLKMPFWKKIVLIVSAVPIAIISNVGRIVITGMLTEWISAGVADFIHDHAGWLMMVFAMLMIWGEMALLSALMIETSIEGPLSFGDRGSPPRRRGPTGGLGGSGGLGEQGPRPDKPGGAKV
ncbi:MAG: exosortase/archaeosortase family protein [Planctomycetota bacterium]